RHHRAGALSERTGKPGKQEVRKALRGGIPRLCPGGIAVGRGMRGGRDIKQQRFEILEAFSSRNGRGLKIEPVAEAPGETWENNKQGLEKGLRGLPKGSLHRLLAEHRGAPYRRYTSRLTVRQVLTWAQAYRQRTGRWPAQRSGAIPEAPGES